MVLNGRGVVNCDYAIVDASEHILDHRTALRKNLDTHVRQYG